MRFAMALLLLSWTGCERASASSEPPPLRPRSAVSSEIAPSAQGALAPVSAPVRAVLVTLDGVRWQDFLRGADGPEEPVFPCVHRLVRTRGLALRDGAACGIVRSAGAANVSLPAYREIFSGRPTRCWSNECPATTEPTLFDELRGEGHDRGALWSIASWEGIARAVRQRAESATVLAGTSASEAPEQDAELSAILTEGAAKSGYPGTSPTYRPDAHTVAAALHVLASDTWRLVHVGLGDADELAHRADRDGYLHSLAEADNAVCRMAGLTEDGDPTLLVVVADHGRADDFVHHGPMLVESNRSFFAAFGPYVAPRGFVCTDGDLLLTDVASVLHDWLSRGPGDRSSFEPLPRRLEVR